MPSTLAYRRRLQYFDLVRIYQRLQSRLFQPQFIQPWMIVSAAWVLPAGFAAVNRVAQTHLNGWDPATMRDLLWESGDWFLYAFLTPAVFAVSKRLPLAQPHITRRASAHLWI